MKDVRSGYPFWSVNAGLPIAFPPLTANVRTEILILGAGITGTLIAQELTDAGHQALIIDGRDVAWGSTSASTALLQYEIDTPMTELARQYDEATAVLAYHSCLEALDLLEARAADIPEAAFRRAGSLYIASHRRAVDAMQQELKLRKQHDFEVRWLDSEDLQDRYGLENSPAAILSARAASMDPYRYTYAALSGLRQRGVAVHDRSKIVSVRTIGSQCIAQTEHGTTITADHVIVATGYAAIRQLGVKVASCRSTYAYVTEPSIDPQIEWMHDTLMWESARPYLYTRRTPDGRCMIGGEDDAVDNEAKRSMLLPANLKKLQRKMQHYLPETDWTPSFSWAGTFAETTDGLPYFGSHPKHGERIHFAMGYGGNGITYSILGAQVIRAHIEGRRHLLSDLYAFERTGHA